MPIVVKRRKSNDFYRPFFLLGYKLGLCDMVSENYKKKNQIIKSELYKLRMSLIGLLKTIHLNKNLKKTGSF